MAAQPVDDWSKANTEAVQGTGDDAAVSKRSAAALGYYHDPFISCVVRKKTRRSPLINRGYYSRVAAVSCLLEDFVKCFKGERTQIISLGSGFDTTFFRLRDRNVQPSLYVEVDFKSTQKRKRALLERHKLIKPRSEEKDSEKSSHYVLVDADLRDVSKLHESLLAVGVDTNLPTFFLSECVLVYMKPEKSAEVISWASREFSRGVIATYEQIRPDDPFGKTMMRNLEMRGCPLYGLKAHPSAAAQEKRFLSLGWKASAVWDMNDVYRFYIPLNDTKRIQTLELFDEFEEWHLIQGHYCIALATNCPSGRRVGFFELEKKARHAQYAILGLSKKKV